MDEFEEVFGKVKSVLFIFPHFDDGAFVSSGLIQLLNKRKILVTVGVFAEKDLKNEELEFNRYCKDLGIKDVKQIKTTHQSLKKDLASFIKNVGPDLVVTFDPGGVTGNSHHTLISLKSYEVLHSLPSDNRPKLLWRVADSEEEKFFGKMPSPLGHSYSSLINVNLKLSESLKKVKAILTNKSAMKGFAHKLRIIEWYLFDHREIYYQVNFATDKLQVKYLSPNITD